MEKYTTILLKKTTYELLKKEKKKLGFKSFDDTIRSLIKQRKILAREMLKILAKIDKSDIDLANLRNMEKVLFKKRVKELWESS